MQNLISTEQAESIIRKHLATTPVESVPLAQAHGRYLRENILSDRPLPPFDRVMMDGIAICYDRYLNGKRTFPIAATQAAGQPPIKLSNPDTCIEVMTGAVLPTGCDCIIPVELIDTLNNYASIHEEASPQLRQHIHNAGSDTQCGEVLLAPGQLLNAPELTIAASCGTTSLKVSALPRILVLSTGDELVAPEATPLEHQIRRSHATALQSIITSRKLGTVDSLHVSDDPADLKDSLVKALTSHDILVITGGVSRGKFDYVAPLLEELLGAPHFHGIAQRPGKPMAFWSHHPTTAEDGSATGGEECKRAIQTDDDPATSEQECKRTTQADDGSVADGEECKRTIFALPGNPVSVMACAARYLLPALTEMISGTRPSPPQLTATGCFNCPPHFTGLIACQIINGRIHLVPPSNSGNFLALASTDGIAELPGNLSRKDLLNEPATFYPWL